VGSKKTVMTEKAAVRPSAVVINYEKVGEQEKKGLLHPAR
jgi:hypothetical protein